MNSFRGPASISTVLLIAGLALLYWSATGLGIIQGANTQEKIKSIRPTLEQ